jgi:hypothetical protein
MGICDVPLTRLFEFYFADDRARVWGEVFACVYDGAIVLQAEEVESGEFLSIDAIQHRAQSDPYTPDGLMALARYLDLYPAGLPPLTRSG